MNESGDAQQFVRDVCMGMRERSWQEIEDHHLMEQTAQKIFYGNTWSFFCGIEKGFNFMEEDGTGKKWDKQYDKFGKGAHGTGLILGKQVFAYTGQDFEFVEPESNETEFTFVE